VGKFLLAILILSVFAFSRKPGQTKTLTEGKLLSSENKQSAFTAGDKLRKINIAGRAQGTTYSIMYYAADSIITKGSIDSLLNRVDASLSIYKTGSLINNFNASKKGALIDAHLYRVVSKSIEISQQTKGLFDITVMPLTQIWGFGTKSRKTTPTEDEIKKILPCVGSQHLHLEPEFLAKDHECTMIDVNGIAQGYSVDLLADLLESYRVVNYIIELGGEIRVKGRKPGNEMMKIGIESPATNEMEAGIFKRILVVDSGAITTSGNYRKFYESKGKIVTHLFNPRTGYSIDNELIAATVFAPDAMTADGYDNALMNMGLSGALKFIEAQRTLSAYFIYRDKSGTIRDTASSRFKRLIMDMPVIAVPTK